MNKRLMNRQYMLENVLALLNNEGVVFKDDAQFQSLHGEMQNRLQQLQSLRSDLLIARMPLSERKAEAKKDYARKMARLIGLVNVVASAQQLDQALQFLSNAPSKIGHGTVDVSLAVSRELLEIAKMYQTDLEAMSKGKEVLEDAEVAFEEFNNIALGPMRRIKKYSELKIQFEALIKQTVAFVKRELKSFFFSWEDDQPDFYSLFLRTIDIPEFGSSTGQEEEDQPEESSIDPINNEDNGSTFVTETADSSSSP